MGSMVESVSLASETFGSAVQSVPLFRSTVYTAPVPFHSRRTQKGHGDLLRAGGDQEENRLIGPREGMCNEPKFPAQQAVQEPSLCTPRNEFGPFCGVLRFPPGRLLLPGGPTCCDA